MKTLLLSFLFFTLSFSAFAIKNFAPNTNNSITGGATYCQGATAGSVVYTYNTCNSGVGGSVGVAVTITWYQNSSNSTTGGSVVSTTSGTCSTAATGSVSYTPSTSSAGISFYYCTITWSGAGTCRGTGTITSASAVRVEIDAAPGTISGATSFCTGVPSALNNTVSGGVWTSDNTSVASINASTGRVDPISAGSATITYSTGCGTNATTTVSVASSPAAVTGATTVCTGSTVTMADATAGGSWNSSNTSLATVDPSTGDVTGIAAGAVTITYLYGSCPATAGLTVATTPSPSISGSTSVVCQGSVISFTGAPAGGTWSASDLSVATIETTGDVTGITAGTTTISYQVTNSCGSAYATNVVTVNPLPIVDTISGALTVCPGATITLVDTTTGGTWSSDNTSAATVDASGIVTGIAPGSANIYYTLTTSCGTDYGVLPITVNDASFAGTITGATTACSGSTLTLADTAAGGTWTSSDTTLAAVSAAGIVTAIAGGSVTISYSVTGSCGTTYATSPLTITTTPGTLAAIGGSATICVGTTPTYTNATSGGVWSTSDAAVASINASTGVVTAVTVGSATLTYDISNACGSVSVTKNITVDVTPSAPAAISGAGSVCSAATTTFSDATAGGAWTSSDNTIASVDATGVVTGNAAGTATITYTLSNSCGSAYVTSGITVSAAPSTPAAIGGTAAICNGSTTTLTDATAAGSWSSSNTSVATIDAAGVVTGLAAGTSTISYIVANTCGSAYAVQDVSVATTPSSPAAITGTTTVCAYATTTLADATAGGTWSSSNASLATVDPSTGVVSGVAAGSPVISYTISNACGAASRTATITVNNGPAPISGSTIVCTAVNTTLTDAVAGGTWTRVNGTGTATVGASTGIVNGATVGTITISYTIGSCRVTMGMTVSQSPAAITGTNTVCEGANRTYANTIAGGTWSSSNAAIASVEATTGIITGITAGSATITYSIGSCYATRAITVNTMPAAITGSSVVCTAVNTTLADATAGGTWSRTNGTGTANVGSTTGTVNGLTLGTVTISYTIAGCRVTHAMTVTQSPAAITGTNTVCEGATRVYANTVAGGTWTSSNSAIATVDPSNGTITGVSAGAATVTYTIGGCYATRAITVNVSPAAIAGSTSVCRGSATTLTNSVSGGTWSRTNGTGTVSVGAATGIVTGTGAGTATISYSIGSCRATLGMTVNLSPATIAGTNTVCEGLTRTYTNTVAGGTWSSSDASLATVDPSSGVITGVAAGTPTITYTIGGCYATRAITVNATPAAISGSSTVCRGGTTTLTETTTGGSWTRTNGTGTATIGAATGIVTGSAVGAVTISYTKNGCRTTLPMTVLGTPASITGTTTVCNGSASTLANATANGTWTSSNTAIASVEATTGIVNSLSAGAATITYATGCGTAATASFTVNDMPATIGGASTLCVGASTTLTNAVSGGTWSSGDVTLATIDGVGVVTGVTAGSVSITYAIGGCYVTTGLTINPLPDVAAITGTTTVCTGANTTLADATTGGVWSISNPTVASVDATGVVTGITGGSAVVSYTATNDCGATTVTASVNVTALPTASISSAGAPCYGYSTNIVLSGTSGATANYSIDGGSAIGATLTGGTYTFSTGTISSTHIYTLIDVTNAGCSATIGSSVTVDPIAMQWVGGTSGHETDWSTASNWACGVVPSTTDNIIIAATSFVPVLPSGGSATVNDLTINSGALVSLASGSTFNVKGTFTNNGSVTGAGSIVLNNTSAQAIAGIGKVNNLELNNSTGATINTGARMTVMGNLLVTAGTLTTGDSLVIGSDSLSTGRVAELPASGAAISGNVKVMQWIQGGYRRYRFWSHPFSNYIALSQIENYIDITGAGGATNGFTTTATNAASAIRYNTMVSNSAASSDPGWKAFTSAYATVDSNRLHQYQGIRLFIRGAKNEGLDGASYTPSSVAIGMVGNLNQGNQTIALAKGSGANQDYNMVGNPYASPVDIGTVIYNAKNAGYITGSSFYVFNPFLGAGGQFQAIPITSTPYYLQANCAFQVRAAHNGDVLSFTENNKGANSTTGLLRAQPEYVSLYIYDANNHPWDMLHVKFNEAATANEDSKFDAGKPSGMDFNFYSLSADNQKLAVDVRPFASEKVIPLGINSTYQQEYTIKAEGVVVPDGGQLYLHDKLLNNSVLLVQGAEYKFTISGDKNTQGDNRFELKMVPAQTAAVQAPQGLQVSMVPNPATDKVSITYAFAAAEKVNVRIVDIAGVSVYQSNTGNQASGTVNVNLNGLAAGVYMVEVTAGNQKVVKRLIKE